MEFEPPDLDSLLDPGLPEEAKRLRMALWTMVNWIIPIRLHPIVEGGDVDYLALKYQLLPRARTLRRSAPVGKLRMRARPRPTSSSFGAGTAQDRLSNRPGGLLRERLRGRG
jgi:hypothetical protein